MKLSFIAANALNRLQFYLWIFIPWDVLHLKIKVYPVFIIWSTADESVIIQLFSFDWNLLLHVLIFCLVNDVDFHDIKKIPLVSLLLLLFVTQVLLFLCRIFSPGFCYLIHFSIKYIVVKMFIICHLIAFKKLSSFTEYVQKFSNAFYLTILTLVFPMVQQIS